MSGNRIRPRIPLPLSVAVLAAGLWSGCSDAPDSVVAPVWSSAGAGSAAQTVGAAASATAAQSQEIAEAIRAQERHTPRLMQMPGVVGTGVSVNPRGRAAVTVFTAEAGVTGLPDRVDDVPVRVEVSGRFFAEPLAPYSPPAAVVDAARVVAGRALDRGPVPVDLAPATGLAAVDASSTTDRWSRPVPIGVSTGHPDITAGTIGARVVDGSGDVFALSNNHVYGKSNDANIGDPVIQPGSVDGGSSPADDIGTLADYYEIVFNDTGAKNTMDAAIALSSTAELDTSTPTELGGYGTPSPDIYGDANDDGSFDNTGDLLNLAVKKFGRTTGPTEGTVAEVNVTVDVCYDFFCSKIARFVDQISITPGDFSDGGDSGSLIVSSSGDHPVALLFAGSSTRTIGNRIDLVLNHFNVKVDDAAGGTTDAPPSATITNPAGGSTVSGSVTVTADATDDGSVTQVEFLVDGESIGVDSDGTDGWSADWVTTDYGDGEHTVAAVATDDANQTGSDQVSVVVDNVDEPPTASIVNPADGSTVSGAVTIQVDAADAEDGAGTLAVEVSVDAGAWQAAVYDSGTGYYELGWDTSGLANGSSHTIDARATDSGTNTTNAAQVTVTVDNSAPATMHVGDLDGSSQKLAQGNWEATVTVAVHDASHAGVPNVTIEGEFHQNGFVIPDSCATDGSGTCSIGSGQMPHKSGKATFVVTAVTGGSLTYSAADNHDPDGDSDGTTIELSK